MAPRVIIVKGLPGSGKSTWATKEVLKSKGRVKRVNKDDLRAMVDCGDYTSENERFILSLRDKIITAAIRANKHIIVDDTNINPIHERHIRELVGPRVRVDVVSFMDVSVEECIKRDKKRSGTAYVGEEVIHRMARQWENWKDVDCSVTFTEPGQYAKNPALPSAIIVDIDGTLAHVTGRSYYDYSRVIEDAVDEVIRDVVVRLAQDHRVIVVSGRDHLCYDDTIRWLTQHRIPYDELLMRADDDKRHDYIVKREIYENQIKGKFNVHLVLDDRNQVVDMWRDELGFKVLQCAHGDF